jgi:hypothetical protein
MSAAFLKRTLLGCWAAWQTIVLTTNVLDGLKALGLLDESWPFASGNYGYVVATTARYGTPVWLNGVLFLGVLAWEATAASLFWVAWWTYRRTRSWLYPAFSAGLSLWMALAIASEVFIAYAVEGTHWRLFTAQLATLLAIELLPERAETPRVL